MFYIYIFAFLAISQVNALPNVFNTRVSSRNIQQEAPLNINDSDYWDADDDFVPYTNARHDAFDWKLLKAILLKDQSNIIISPFSIKLVLALLSEAASGESATQKELSSVLPDLQNPVLVRELFKKVLGSLKEESLHYVLNIGTKIYVDKFIEPRQRYAAIINSHYDTEIDRLDFHNSEYAAQVANNWCSNITAGHLKDFLTKSSFENSVMLMLNAIYFDGYWRHEFPENNTVELPFFVHPTNQIRATYMSQTNYFYYFESKKLNAKIIRLPYKGKKFSMTILLPNAKGGLEELIREVDGDGLKRLQWLMDETQLKVTIPKFKFDYTSHVKEVLQSIGINDIFTPAASLPGLARGSAVNNQLMVSDIIQKSGLIVHEKGSTVYSATEVELVNKFGGNLTEFNANRPFIFFIEDETTGTLLFAGKVTDPTK